jgi:hypothetical protein
MNLNPLSRRQFVAAIGLASVAPRTFARAAPSSEVEALKREILALAQSFSGQGDPDYSKQHALEALIAPLLAAAPQPPVVDRLELLAAAWKQVWGLYDYRGGGRGVDPSLAVDEIYQVVFREGFYYNVSPLWANGDPSRERIGMLKGRYRADRKLADALRVRFVDYPGFSTRPPGYALWDLPAALETGALVNDIEIVPPAVVKLFFGTGALREIYTDGDMRLLYGASSTAFEDPYLYVMTRVGDVPDLPGR